MTKIGLKKITLVSENRNVLFFNCAALVCGIWIFYKALRSTKARSSTKRVCLWPSVWQTAARRSCVTLGEGLFLWLSIDVTSILVPRSNALTPARNNTAQTGRSDSFTPHPGGTSHSAVQQDQHLTHIWTTIECRGHEGHRHWRGQLELYTFAFSVRKISIFTSPCFNSYHFKSCFAFMLFLNLMLSFSD